MASHSLSLSLSLSLYEWWQLWLGRTEKLVKEKIARRMGGHASLKRLEREKERLKAKAKTTKTRFVKKSILPNA